MAEAILRSRAASRSLNIEVRSAGVSTVDGMPISANALEVLRRRQIDHQGESRMLEEQMVNWADLILTMTSSHKRGLIGRFPDAVDKTHTLLEYAVPDGSVLDDLKELERLYSEWHMKQALGEQMPEADRARMIELEKKIPSFDIADPFGGPLPLYESCAAEIERALDRLLDKLEDGGEQG